MRASKLCHMALPRCLSGTGVLSVSRCHEGTTQVSFGVLAYLDPPLRTCAPHLSGDFALCTVHMAQPFPQKQQNLVNYQYPFHKSVVCMRHRIAGGCVGLFRRVQPSGGAHPLGCVPTDPRHPEGPVGSTAEGEDGRQSPGDLF